MRVDAANQVIEAAMARASALAESDAEGLFDLLHEEFRWTSHVGATYDRAQYIRRNTEGPTVWRSQSLLDPQVVVVGETAILSAEVDDVMLSNGDESERFRMPMTQVWFAHPVAGSALLVMLDPVCPNRPHMPHSLRRCGSTGCLPQLGSFVAPASERDDRFAQG